MLSSCIMFKANFEVTQAARHSSVDRNEDPETKLAVKDKRPGFQFAVGSLYRKNNKTQLLHIVDICRYVCSFSSAESAENHASERIELGQSNALYCCMIHWLDGFMDGCMHTCMVDGWMDGWMDDKRFCIQS